MHDASSPRASGCPFPFADVANAFMANAFTCVIHVFHWLSGQLGFSRLINAEFMVAIVQLEFRSLAVIFDATVYNARKAVLINLFMMPVASSGHQPWCLAGSVLCAHPQ